LRVRSVSREEVWTSAGVQGAWVGDVVTDVPVGRLQIMDYSPLIVSPVAVRRPTDHMTFVCLFMDENKRKKGPHDCKVRRSSGCAGIDALVPVLRLFKFDDNSLPRVPGSSRGAIMFADRSASNGCSDDFLLPCAGAFTLLICVVLMVMFGTYGEFVSFLSCLFFRATIS